MNTLTISTENKEGFSSISNNFIDYYMTDANGDFVKIYLYLVRLHSNGMPISVSEIADHFNCTEKDVCRAIRYWISVDVLKFKYSENGDISGIVLLNLGIPKKDSTPASATNIVSFTPAILSQTAPDNASDEKEKKDVEKNSVAVKKTSDNAVISTRTVPEKEKHNLKTINSKLNDEVFSDIIMQAEAYFNKTITQSDTDTLIYIYDTLKLSVDLIEYLLEYCASIGKTKFSYIEKVAQNWYKDGITTREEAKQQSLAYNPLFRSIFKELCITNRTVPTSTEIAFIEAWQQEYAFSDAIIIEACKRAVLSKPNSANFSYVNGILEDWHKHDVKCMDDIKKLSDAFRANIAKSKNAKKTSASTNPNSFSNFEQKNLGNELDEMTNLFINEVNEN